MSTDHLSSIPEDVWKEAADASLAARPGIERAWQLAGQTEPAPVAAPDDDAAWADLLTRLAMAQGLNGSHRMPDRAARRNERRVGMRLRWMTPLAGVALLIVAGVLFWRVPITVHAPAGEVASVELPDGSRVELNSGTSLRYARGFSVAPFIPAPVRRVELEGEAFFEVTPSVLPFLIVTANAETRVLGTSFNVWARGDEAPFETRVTLATGRVQVRGRVWSEAVVLLRDPGDMARIGASSDGLVVHEPATLEHVTSWRRRGFVFIAEPLSAVLAELERRFGLVVDVEQPALVSKRMTVLIARDATPESILTDVCLALECRFRKSSQGYALYEAGTLPTR